jgi:hypothetical protein
MKLRQPMVAAAACALLVAACGGSDDHFAEASALVRQAKRFDTATEASETLARASSLLLDDARRCHDRFGAVPRCDARSSAAGLTEVLAVHVLTCTAPGRFELRRSLAAYLDEIASLTPDDPIPKAPAPPSC